MNPYRKTILGGTIAGILAGTFLAVVYGVWGGEEAYKTKALWGTVAVCSYISAVHTAKLAFRLGKQTGIDAGIAQMKEDSSTTGSDAEG